MLKDWNSDWHKNSERSPVKSSDPFHKKKNNILKKKVKNFDIQHLYNNIENESSSNYLKSNLPKGFLI